jgi:pyruvyl transferase EpsO
MARDGQAEPGSEIRRLQEVTADALAKTGGETPFALVDFPDHPNVGDSAIWLGTTRYFRDRRGMRPRYVASTAAFSEAALRAALPKGPIFVHGGGNFGDLWPRHHEFRLLLLERFPDREIVQLPQSIHFDDPARTAETARAIARHRNFKLFVRDRPSYDFAAARFDCETTLCPDMALFLGPLVRSSAEVDVLHLRRTDKERATQRAMEGTGYTLRVTDWLDEGRLSLQGAKLLRAVRELAAGRRERQALRSALYDTAAHARLRRGCRLLSSGQVVVTDRLHAHILCLLLGIPHAVLDNSYGKLTRFLDAWTGDIAGVHRADSAQHAERWAAAMVRRVAG